MLPRRVLHVDLDAFYAAVEQRDTPSLRGRPVVVGGKGRRSVVCAASYEARRFGVKSAMPMGMATRLCPDAVVVAPRFEAYAAASQRFFEILASYSPQVEGLSLDEAFLELTGTERLLGPSERVARDLKQRVAEEVGLIASVGIAPNKFLAKLASDIDKPNGLRIVLPEEVRAFLAPLPVDRLWGAGVKTAAQLQGLGLRTIGDVAAYPEEVLCRRLGRDVGQRFAQLARGADVREVVGEAAPKSLGHRHTFEEDVAERSEVALTLLGLADQVAARLRAQALMGRTLSLIIRYDDFRQLTRQRSLPSTCDGAVLAREVWALLAPVAIEDEPGLRVRLCGLSVTGLQPRDGAQLSLLPEPNAQGGRLGDALDAVHRKFGDSALVRGVFLPQGRRKR